MYLEMWSMSANLSRSHCVNTNTCDDIPYNTVHGITS